MSTPRVLPAFLYRAIGRFSFSAVARRLHPVLYRMTGGASVLGRTLGCEIVLVTTVGHRSGRPRTVALFGVPDSGRWVVIASRGGSAKLPGWYRNLLAEPRVTLEHGRWRGAARATVAQGDERARLWRKGVAAYPGYELYQQRTTYEIPVVVLTPEAEP